MWLWLKDACIDVGVGFFVLGFGTAWFVPDLTSTQLSMAVVLLVLGVVLFFASAFIALAIGEGK
jgi:hypothetical protein